MPDPTLIRDFGPRIVAWQRQHGRHALPWQQTRDPYRVWLSEIMLQQTQVTTVLGYYERFLQRFPTVQALAAAPLDEVLTMWAGLGYYSRARHLHACAQAVVAQHGGAFPGSAIELQGLPGIGRSTAAAIAAFCFGERVAILDGNVKRVLSRVLAFEGDLARAAEEKQLWQHAGALVPAQGVEAYTQGLMDLGATLCTARAPRCPDCPVDNLCRGRTEPARFPVKSRKLRRGRRENWWLWLVHERRVLLQQRPETGVWAGLWTLPLFEDEASARAAVASTCEVLPRIEHALTHFDWVLHTLRCEFAGPAPATLQGTWVEPQDLGRYGMPAPLRKLLA